MKAIASAITEAKQELKYVSSELSALAARRKQIENFLTHAQPLAGRPLRPQVPAPEIPKISDRKLNTNPWPEYPKRSNAQNTLDVLKKVGHPMTIKDILDALAKQGTPVGGEFKHASLRSVLSTKGNIFEKVSPGIWALKDWPPDLKQLKQPRVQ